MCLFIDFILFIYLNLLFQFYLRNFYKFSFFINVIYFASSCFFIQIFSALKIVVVQFFNLNSLQLLISCLNIFVILLEDTNLTHVRNAFWILCTWIERSYNNYRCHWWLYVMNDVCNWLWWLTLWRWSCWYDSARLLTMCKRICNYIRTIWCRCTAGGGGGGWSGCSCC